MIYTWPPFAGDLGKRFAYDTAIKYLGQASHNLSNKTAAVGRDWVEQKISFLPGTRYHFKSGAGMSPFVETWFIPFQKKQSGRALKKYSKGAVEALCSAVDTIFGTAPPGFALPGMDVWDDMESMHSGTNISKHISGQGLEWTDLLIGVISRLDAETREGGKIAKDQLAKIINDSKTCWLAVEQTTPVRTASKEVFESARVRVGPSGDTEYNRYVGSRKHGHCSSPFSCAMDIRDGGTHINGALLTYRRMNTDAQLANSNLMREHSYDPMQSSIGSSEAFWHQTSRLGSIAEEFHASEKAL